MVDYQQALFQYIKAYEQITPESLHQELIPMFSENAYFEDPFNQVVGPDNIAPIFEHMFDKTESPRFIVMNYALNHTTAFIWWEFRFFDSAYDKHHIMGVSKIAFNDVGKVLSHIDYWDTGRFVYQKVPILAMLVRWVNRFFVPNRN